MSSWSESSHPSNSPSSTYMMDNAIPDIVDAVSEATDTESKSDSPMPEFPITEHETFNVIPETVNSTSEPANITLEPMNLLFEFTNTVRESTNTASDFMSADSESTDTGYELSDTDTEPTNTDPESADTSSEATNTDSESIGTASEPTDLGSETTSTDSGSANSNSGSTNASSMCMRRLSVLFPTVTADCEREPLSEIERSQELGNTDDVPSSNSSPSMSLASPSDIVDIYEEIMRDHTDESEFLTDLNNLPSVESLFRKKIVGTGAAIPAAYTENLVNPIFTSDHRSRNWQPVVRPTEENVVDYNRNRQQGRFSTDPAPPTLPIENSMRVLPISDGNNREQAIAVEPPVESTGDYNRDRYQRNVNDDAPEAPIYREHSAYPSSSTYHHSRQQPCGVGPNVDRRHMKKCAYKYLVDLGLYNRNRQQGNFNTSALPFPLYGPNAVYPRSSTSDPSSSAQDTIAGPFFGGKKDIKNYV
ncbi:hypothetical protein BJV82DRAFT_579133 [Fennellomyces sp. T-0311]|nr:hypothetical protein BJV82DRAFT_579133 [Fennellomyces sp. T-0311]